VKKRSQVPFCIIDSVFSRYGLPVELKYLAVIESELKPSALSHVGARGPWQLMPATAHILGLKVNRQCDERSNYYKSTIAAAKYLRDLYALFDDWLLVLAAYNGGPRPVYAAIHKSGSRNFWVLQEYLPAESREHVKKFIATHYYFEGRGSETTLTRAENAKFKNTVRAFAKKLRAPESTQTGVVRSARPFTDITGNQPFLSFDFNQIFQSRYDESGYGLLNNENGSVQSETPGQKFSRLMKVSEESLKNSRKII
jgi:membrane-bound lytic murein transglycosylase MltF